MIEGKRVHLRTVQEEDIALIFSALASIRMKGDYLPATLISEHSFRLQFYEHGFWTEENGKVVILDGERVVGAIWFEQHMFLDCLDLHFYIFNSEDRKKGFMKEALSLFSSYLFATKKIERLQLSIPDYSQAAIRTAQRCGFKFEGIARSALFSRGGYVDLCIYSLIRSDKI